MARRKLTKEEAALWRKVVENTERLRPGEPTLPIPDVATPVKAVPSTRSKEAAAPKPPSKPAPLVQDRRTLRDVKRGKKRPEARIDLHGMTLDRAHPALRQFILSSQASGRKMVLVITGKGRRKDGAFGMAPYERGVLNRQVPQWLAQPPLAQAVVQVSPAFLKDGGDGAYYVFLRRIKST